MICITQCAESSGLAPNEMILGVTPSSRHHSLFASYLLNKERSPAAIRDMIISDLRSFLDLGAKQRAADLLIVLRLFLSDYLQARRTAPRREEVAGHLLTREKFVNCSSSYDTRAKRAARDYDLPVDEEEDRVIIRSSRQYGWLSIWSSPRRKGIGEWPLTRR